MNTILIPLLQGAGPVALAVVSFALAFTWPSLIEPVSRFGSERARLGAFASVGAMLLLAASVVYVVPGLLLVDDLGAIVALPVVATWAIVATALALRAALQSGVARVVSAAFAIVAVFIGGYLGINVAALMVGIELGIQPDLFHDATGAPLYSPYHLAQSIPAMLLGVMFIIPALMRIVAT